MANKDVQIRTGLESGDNNKLNKAVRLTKSGAPRGVLDLPIGKCMEKGWTDRVLELAELDISSQARDRLVATYARKSKGDKLFGKLLSLAARGV